MIRDKLGVKTERGTDKLSVSRELVIPLPGTRRRRDGERIHLGHLRCHDCRLEVWIQIEVTMEIDKIHDLVLFRIYGSVRTPLSKSATSIIPLK